ncbi:putative two-component system histidine kinase [Microlunatus phosphovorus NM-1]|uniref:histidine kinase n=1 Tax=Microlunatus phosphovorus (strain ATCC 700054 / DSM 10555 / JCM 9379 / NBRC 101784 / NCIMB 13414 / VKM Ac-1990 / NM-1) TaxID=1032480 RepID=F5XTA3_MICPN|nr:GAF domain-containing sensor histidine kinase [Microlunatus phosphovorus]BAK34975.1 putative two-component system histidine kinase [Microlunatus phosphovorus NM-1]
MTETSEEPTPDGSMPSAVPDAEQLASRFEADGVLLYLIDGQELSIVDIWPPHASAGTLKLQVGFGVTGLVARTRKPVLINADSPRNALHRRLLRLEPRQTVARMCVPLPGLEGEMVGVLAVHRSPDRPFDQADLDDAESLAALLGLQLHANRLWRAVSRHRTERDRLIEQAISAQEAERRRIAFDLHDGVTTALASMSFHLSSADLTVSRLEAGEPEGAGRRDAFDSVRQELATTRGLVDLAYNQTRAAISGLHSLVLDDLGLVAAIESLVQSAGRPGGPRIDFFVDPEADVDEVPDHAAAALYRIAQEVLSNAVKHSAAKRIVISLRRVGDSMVLGCADDGTGFDPEERLTARAQDNDGAQHFGLSSVAERCAMMEASLRIESAPGRGTTVLVELPLR